MSAINYVLMMGNLTRDPETRKVGNGVSVASFGLAVDEQKKKDGAAPRPCFVDIVAWDKQADVCAQYLRKGSRVLVEGRVQMDEWTDKESGAKRTKLRVRADRIHFLGRAGGDRSGGEGGGWEEEPSLPPNSLPPAPPQPARSNARMRQSA